MAALSYAEQVQQAYLAYYGRPADPAGQQYWVNQLTAANGNLNSIINAFGNSAESTALYGGSSTAAQVNAIYQTLFGRAADVTGLNFYVNGIVSGQFTLASVALNIYNGATGTDATELTAKLGYADSFTAALSQSVAGQVAYSGNAAASNARAAVASVVDSTSQATATAALSTTIANIGTGAVAQTFTLTNGVDTLTGSTGNDVFKGTIVPGATGTAASTLSIGDTVTGKGANETLNLVIDSTGGAAALPAGLSVTGIQNLSVNATGSNTITLDASVIGGLTNAALTDAGTGALTLNNVAKGVTVTLNGQDAAATTVGYNGLAATDTVNVALNGSYGATTASNVALTLGTGTTAAAGSVAPNSVAITGTGGRVELIDSSLTKVTANVSGATTLAFNNEALKSVDLTGSTGKVTVDLFDNGANLGTAREATSGFTFQGGSAADTLKVNIADLGNYAAGTWSIKGDSTSSSVLDVVTAAVGASAGAVTIGTAGATLSAINSITGFKTLDITQYDTSAASVGSLTEGAISIDVSKVTSVTDFKFDGALQNTTGNTLTLGAIAITGEGNAHTFTVANNVQAASAAAATDSISITPLIDNGNNVATLTLTSAGGVTVTGGTATGALAAGGHAINIATGTTSIETFNLISTGTGAEPASGYYNSLAGGTPGAGGTAGFGINAGLNAKIVVTGDHSINVGSINGVAQTVDASGLTANFAVTQTGTANDTLLGGAGKNAITLSGGVDTVDLTHSLGKVDTITMSAFNAAAQTSVALATSVTGFTNASGTGDNLHLAGTTALTSATIATTGTNAYVNGAVSLTATVGSQGNVAFSGVTGSASLTDYVKAAAAAAFTAATAKGVTVEFQVGSDTYVLDHQTAATAGYTAGSDHLVKLVGVTGVTGLSTTASDASHIFIG